MTLATRKCRLIFLILAVIVALILVPQVTFNYSSFKVYRLSNGIQVFKSSHTNTLPSNHQVLKSLSVTSSEKRNLGGFMTAMRYSGQQGSGIRAIKSLQCWASGISMPMNILEPTITDSTLAADFPPSIARPSLPNSTHLLLSDLFDIEQFNKDSNDRHLPQLMPRRQFIVNAPKNVIIVWMASEGTRKEAEVIWPENNDEYGKCLEIETADRQWRKYARRFSKGDYCIIKVVKAYFIFARSEIFTPGEAKSVIYGHWSPEEVTVFFSLWRAVWKPPLGNQSALTDEDCYSTTSGEYFLPSKSLINHAQLYEQQYLRGKNTLAIMFRLERMIELLQNSHDQSLSVAKCLDKVIEITQEIQGEKASLVGIPFVTIDIGESGSNTWVKTSNHFKQNVTYLQRKSEETISTISDMKWTIKDWEETFKHIPGVVNNPAYIAALQRVLASRADCLVLVGGGYFQSIALKDYQENHLNKVNQCYKFICAKEGITT